jgi:hypothetical protein
LLLKWGYSAMQRKVEVISLDIPSCLGIVGPQR